MTDRLQAARAAIDNPIAVDEYKARMGGYVDSALSLLWCVARDALDNLARNPEDERTKQVLVQLSIATQALEPLVRLLCPMTAQAPVQFVVTPTEVPKLDVSTEAAGHG